MKVISIYGQSLMDITIQEVVNIEALFEIAVLNQVSISDEIDAGQSINVNINFEGSSDYFKRSNRSISTFKDQYNSINYDYGFSVDVINESLVHVLLNQSTLDIALQESGTIESVFDYLISESISISDLPTAGTLVNAKFSTIDQDIRSYYKSKKLKPATAYTVDPYEGLRYAVEEYAVIDYWV